MFDTMKDKKIGPAEVMEKFGVPPEKVIEVQSLIGDSTDNVPGVPGIGVKTAAQLIGEYGDLETLLARVAEIKQEKRRQALIENAENARLSKKLVTLDDHVVLDVPIGDLAVHEPDYKRLVAFLKAMEFHGLTRRVAEFSGVDAAEIAPEPRLAGGPAPIRRRRGAAAAVRQAGAAGRPLRPREKYRTRKFADAAGARGCAPCGGAQRKIRPHAIRGRAQPRPAPRLDRARARKRLCRHRHADDESRSDAGRAVRLRARGRAE
jgi:DNA polymerase-1